MRRKYGFVAALLCVLLLAGMGLTTLYVDSGKQQEKTDLVVVTSFYPMYIAANNVIGDLEGISLQNLSEPQTGCLHDYQLTPADMKKLQMADVFIVNGGGIENFLSDVAANYPELIIVNASENVELLEQEAHDHDHEEDSQEEIPLQEDVYLQETENAHAWMSISDYMVQVETIAEGLAAADVSHASGYRENAARYRQELEPLAQEVSNLKEKIGGGSIISFHEAYDYVAKDLGLTVAFTLNLDEERQVSAGEVAEVISAVRDGKIQIVLAEELYGSDMGETVLKETDAQVIYLDTLVSGDYEKDSYKNGMKENIRLLKEAFAQ
jgi:zinc transport system substrate-binding protein